jgi:parallel beta-helix repeat protein
VQTLKRFKNQLNKILYLLFSVLIIFIIFINIDGNINKNSELLIGDNLETENIINREFSPKMSGVMNYRIHIDGNWSFTAGNYSWCTGTGTWSDPYMIQDLIMDGGGINSSIVIENTYRPFKIDNITIYNSGGTPEAGINLKNVDNGTIVNCNISNNNGYGISLSNLSENNTISFNTIYDNGIYGIQILNSNYTNLRNNTIYNHNNNFEAGIYLNNSANYTELFNNTLNNNYYGIQSINSSNLKIAQNNISVVDHGIIFQGYLTQNCLVSNNTITISIASTRGILSYGSYNSFYNNTINSANVGTGIYIAGSNCLVKQNSILDCTYGIYINGDFNNISFNDLDTEFARYAIYLAINVNYTRINNNSFGGWLYYGILLFGNNNFNEILNNSIYRAGVGVVLNQGSSYNQIYSNFINESVTGIYLYINSNYNNLTGNKITYCMNGTRVFISSFNKIWDEYVYNSTEVGISIWGSWNNSIWLSDLKNNAIGIKIFDMGVAVKAENNSIYWNRFMNNYINSLDYGSNNKYYKHWDGITPSGNAGNYWDNYTGLDGDGDGRGDTPYSIWSNGTDLYPLIFENFSGYIDFDLDGITDNVEKAGSANQYDGKPTDPYNADTDGDGLSDLAECTGSGNTFDFKPTNPNKADTDGDNYSDKEEITAGTDPNNPNSYPGAGSGIDPFMIFLIFITTAGLAGVVIVIIRTKRKNRKA